MSNLLKFVLKEKVENSQEKEGKLLMFSNVKGELQDDQFDYPSLEEYMNRNKENVQEPINLKELEDFKKQLPQKVDFENPIEQIRKELEKIENSKYAINYYLKQLESSQNPHKIAVNDNNDDDFILF